MSLTLNTECEILCGSQLFTRKVQLRCLCRDCLCQRVRVMCWRAVLLGVRAEAEKVTSLEKAVICHWSKYQWGFSPPFSGTMAGHRCLRSEESE